MRLFGGSHEREAKIGYRHDMNVGVRNDVDRKLQMGRS